MLDNRQGIPAFTLLFLPKWFKPLAVRENSFALEKLSDLLSQQELLELAFFGKGSVLDNYFDQGKLFDYWLTQINFDNNYTHKLNVLQQAFRETNVKPSEKELIFIPDITVIQKEKLFFVSWLDNDDLVTLNDHQQLQSLLESLFRTIMGYMPIDVIARTFPTVFPFFINELISGDN